MAGDEKPLDPALKTTVNRPDQPVAERRIGAYRVLRELGHGGMGTVYLAAHDDDEYRKRVAIKIIRGLDSAEVVRLFRRERQILAGLEPPYIARLFDGGSTEEGLPYFVMEYIEGQAIDTFCDERRLSVHERLKLFQGVCAAVQYAHRNLVVHRDIKPGNILVTAEGVPKLMDFGIARLLNPEIAGEVPTGTGLAMTPEYASPEQARGAPITTTTDVYSLGVVPCELLTGRRPYKLKTHDALEVLRAVCEEEPERPSAAVGRTEGRRLPSGVRQTTTPESASRTREGTPERLRRRLRGDLDNIVLMALRKEPQRRYGSVEALSEDIRRYLDGLPVSAHKPTLGYRASKFVRRNVLGVGIAAAAFLVAVGFGIVMAVQAERIARERDRANREAESAKEVSEFLVKVFEVSDPDQSRGATVTARELLDDAANDIEGRLLDQPLVKARLELTLAGVYEGMGLYDPALALAEKSLELRRRHLPPDGAAIAESLALLGSIRSNRGDDAQAVAALRGAVEIAENAAAPAHKRLAEDLNLLGMAYDNQGKDAAAEPLLVRALEINEKVLGPDHPSLAENLNNLGRLHLEQRQYAQAEPLLLRALAIDEKALGPDHPHLAPVLGNLATVYVDQDKVQQAEPLFLRAIAIDEKALGPDKGNLAGSLIGLAAVYSAQGRYAQAEPLILRAVAIDEKSAGAEGVATANDLIALAELDRHEGKPDQAGPPLERSLRILDGAAPLREFSRYLRARALFLAGRIEEARAEARALLGHGYRRRDFLQLCDELGVKTANTGPGAAP